MPEATVIPATTPVYVVGFNMPGFLPESEASLHLTVDGARAALVEALEEAAESMWSDDDTDDDVSMLATAELVKGDREGDVNYSVLRYGGWSTIEADGYAYSITTSTIGTAFPHGDDDSDDYGRLLEEFQTM